MGTPRTPLRSPFPSPAFLSVSRFWNKSNSSKHVYKEQTIWAERERQTWSWMGWNESERWQETKRCETPAVGDNWPWRGRAVWGCSSLIVRWRCLPPLPVQPAVLCDWPQGWRGGSRRSHYLGHYWPERRSKRGRMRTAGSGGQGAGLGGGNGESEGRDGESENGMKDEKQVK